MKPIPRSWLGYSNRIINDMVWRQAYKLGWRKPRYPVPALLEHNPERLHPQKLWDYECIRSAYISYGGYN